MPRHLALLFALASIVPHATLAEDAIAGLARTCDVCHGFNGVSAGESMPSIAGLSESYLSNILLQWKRGERFSATMGRLVKGYTDDELAALARYYANLPWTPIAQAVDAEAVAKGKVAVARCFDCHGDTGGQPDDDMVPKLNGQWAEYIELELLKYRDPDLKMPHKRMRKHASKLDAAEIGQVADFFASQSK